MEIKPVNKRLLVEIVEGDTYKKSKTGLIIPNSGVMTANGTQAAPNVKLLVKALAEDVTLNVKPGDEIHIESPRYIYFEGEEGQKLTLIKEEWVEAVIRN